LLRVGWAGRERKHTGEEGDETMLHWGFHQKLRGR
jgi:hypothetical protein